MWTNIFWNGIERISVGIEQPLWTVAPNSLILLILEDDKKWGHDWFLKIDVEIHFAKSISTPCWDSCSDFWKPGLSLKTLHFLDLLTSVKIFDSS